MKKKRTAVSGFLRLRVLMALVLCIAATCSVVSGTLLAFFRAEVPATVSHPGAAGLTFAERVACQRAIEEVYWHHRFWPKERSDPKPSLDAVMSQAQLEKKVEDYLRKSQALQDYWQHPIAAEQLQAEIDRMAKHTRQPEVLRELFAALGNDPVLIAECLARPNLAQRLRADLGLTSGVPRPPRNSFAAAMTASTKQGSSTYLNVAAIESIAKAAQVSYPYHVPAIANVPNVCINDTWTAPSTINAPAEIGRAS